MTEQIKEKVIPVEPEQVKEVIEDAGVKFTKAQLVKSQKYIHRRDALTALLTDDEQYSFKQVDEVLKKFDEGVKK